MAAASTEIVEFVDAGDGCRLWTATAGAGVPTVLCHGGPGMWDYLRPIAAAVEDISEVHRWDQRGGGRSDRTPPFTTQRFVDDLEALRRHFGLERWIVAGHSWGARLALEYALNHPQRTTALIYISGTGIGNAWRPAYYAERLRRLAAANAEQQWSALAKRIRTDEEDREYCTLTWMTDYVDAAFGRERALAMLAEGMLPNFDVNAQIGAGDRSESESAMVARCRGLPLPVLIIHGADDPRPVSATDSLLAALPNARRAVVDAAGHMPWDDQRGLFADELRQFILSAR